MKEKESIEVLKVLGLIKNMSQEFRLKEINETKNYLLEEIEQKELVSRKQKEVCKF